MSPAGIEVNWGGAGAVPPSPLEARCVSWRLGRSVANWCAIKSFLAALGFLAEFVGLDTFLCTNRSECANVAPNEQTCPVWEASSKQEIV